MAEPCSLFEGLDLLDLWHLYGQINRAADARSVSISKVSRRSRELLLQLGMTSASKRGAPHPADVARIESLRYLRLAYQQWRLEQGQLKVLATFTTAVAAWGLDGVDLLPDIFLSAEQIRDHLFERRVDLLLSSTLDLAGVLMDDTANNAASPFAVIPLYRDELMLGLNPRHPLTGMSRATPEDCQEFESPAYPPGLATNASQELSRRGLWRYAASNNRFEPKDWILGMRSITGLCYVSALLLDAVPTTRELALVPMAEHLQQVNGVVVLRELANHPRILREVQAIKSQVALLLSRTNYTSELIR